MEIETLILKFAHKSKRTRIANTILKKSKSQRAEATRLQDLTVNYSSQNGVALVEDRTKLPGGQKKEPGNRPTYIQSTHV